jgi:G3E family GTPase
MWQEVELMKIKTDIFSGFLGAGKTMMIKKLITEKLSRENIMIIENEFGEVGIDGSILKNSSVQVKEITAGCICCSISGDFKKSVMEVVENYKPKRIIIEPTGVGKLSEILGILKCSELKNIIEINMVITLIDALKYDIYINNFNEFYSDQIRNAKTLILSRTQHCSDMKLEKITAALRMLNNKANIITTPWDKLKADSIINAAEQAVKDSLKEKVNLLKGRAAASSIRLQSRHNAGDVFETWGIETPKKYSKEKIIVALKKLQDANIYGTVLRAKGIVQTSSSEWIQFDYVPEEFEFKSTNPEYTGRLCVIGSKLNKDNIEKLFF